MSDVCDFCGEGIVTVRYECRDFTSTQAWGSTIVDFDSHDYWAACRGCQLLIDADDREGLMKRAIEINCKEMRMSVVPAPLIAHLRLTYEKFFANRLKGYLPK